ncbi:hypothetical protein JHK82_043146 [Glycine max]|nr:hypothetical protein JHK87_043081 [Glycine soja]KAG4949939.1 hypothetical protein JHK86_043178 [Glycine max]KAG4957441.1 hypothetical protein JHK85_043821 [Glycine max]KAG5106176.1 hypothetical protein JHK82_043146 [Glycine max]KAG5117256.1 hypothetical protein JHK84_043369 [Glycine max]
MKTKEAKENAVCVLVRLSQNKEEEEAMIGRAVAILHLVKLLEGGGLRGKKNVATMWYTLCLVAKENKVKAVSAGVMRALVELMVGLGSSMEDLGLSLVYLVGMVVAVAEGIYDFRDSERFTTKQHHLLIQVFDSLQLGQVSSMHNVELSVFS